ncbi:MAG: hypothetical protein DMF78_25870 [Acidobacteria bacterium]|nr:MAG: hypothetical protein DMF78_25870 [Acidobacteriota bacterium]
MASETAPVSLMARDTVAVETRAMRATSPSRVGARVAPRRALAATLVLFGIVGPFPERLAKD